MNNKLTVSIYIPAYNEENNIKNILESIIVQKQDNFILQEIVVISDGSTDQTVSYARKVHDPRIEIKDCHDRKGKVYRLNEMLRDHKTDIFVQFDGDVRLKNRTILQELVIPFILNPQIDFVCGAHNVLPPKTFVERLAYFGVKVWQRATESLGDRAERYHCTGQIRAFSKFFAGNFTWPLEVSVKEDLYAFYFAKKNNYKIFYAQNAEVFYRLPSTVEDYIKQMSRFMYSPKHFPSYFETDFLKRYETMNSRIKIKSFFHEMFLNPFYIVASYSFLHTFTKLYTFFKFQKQVWDIAPSSKE